MYDTCLDYSDLEAIREFKIGCETVKENFMSCKTGLDQCLEVATATAWYEDPYFVIAGVTVGISLGIIIGALFVD